MPEEIIETSQPTESRSANWTKVVLVVVLGLGLLLIAAYGGYWYGIESSKFKSLSASGGSKPQLETQSKEDMSNWEIYNNEKYGFKIKYPPLWIVSQNTDRTSFIAGEKGLKFEVILLDKTREKTCGPYTCYPSIHIVAPFENTGETELSLEDWVKNFFMDRKVTLTEEASNSLVLEKTTIDSFPAIIMESAPGYGYIFILNGGAIYPIVFVDKNPTFDQILSTFKFLD